LYSSKADAIPSEGNYINDVFMIEKRPIQLSLWKELICYN